VLVGSLVVLSLTKQSFSEYQSEQPREPILKAAADQSMRVGHFGPKADPLNDGCQIVNGDAMWLRDDEGRVCSQYAAYLRSPRRPASLNFRPSDAGYRACVGFSSTTPEVIRTPRPK
jgi:hypothetical protein